jgi:hypothetical protein
MDAKSEHRSATEAMRDLMADSGRPRRHEDAIPVYLGAMAYEESKTRHAEDEEPRPVDEPAPQPAVGAGRGRRHHGR